MSNPIEAAVTIDNNEDEDDEILELREIPKRDREIEPRMRSTRPSILERMRSSKSKSETSEEEEEEEEEEEDAELSEEDEIKPLEERKRKQGTEAVSSHRPSFHKQTSRYEDRLRNEDLAVQAAFEKRKESKKLSQQQQHIKPTSSKPTPEEAYNFFTQVEWGPEEVIIFRQ